MKRNLDGVYFRVRRDGKYENVCFSDLTRKEQEQMLEDRDVEWLKFMCFHLSDTLKEIGEQFDVVRGD